MVDGTRLKLCKDTTWFINSVGSPLIEKTNYLNKIEIHMYTDAITYQYIHNGNCSIVFM